MNPKDFFNPNGSQSCKIIGCETDGVINFVTPSHKWAENIWDVMLSNTWFPTEVDMSRDKLVFENFTKEEKFAYKLVLSQLIVNDSIQTHQLMDNMSRYITDPAVDACIARQAFEEALHSRSYATLVDTLFPEISDYIYGMYKYDEELKRKNVAISDMYRNIIKNDKDPDVLDMLMASVANNVLEGLVFQAGFVTMWYFADRGLIGTGKMISFIERDETGTHIPLFRNIFKAIVREFYGLVSDLPDEVKDNIVSLVKHMADVEKRWMNYITKDLLLFSEDINSDFINHKANKILTNLGLDPVYDTSKDNPLMELYKRYSMLTADIKTAFFENKVSDYSVSEIDMDL